jgi:hypothetical protein
MMNCTCPGFGGSRGRCSNVRFAPFSLKTATLYSLGKLGAIAMSGFDYLELV